MLVKSSQSQSPPKIFEKIPKVSRNFLSRSLVRSLEWHRDQLHYDREGDEDCRRNYAYRVAQKRIPRVNQRTAHANPYPVHRGAANNRCRRT